MVCLLLKHLTYVTNIFCGLGFECEVKNKYISIFFYEPSPIFWPIFLAPAVTVGERRELWILPPFFFFGLFFCL